MKTIVKFLLLLVLFLQSSKSFSQKQLLDSLPGTKEEFKQSEPAVINSIHWLENTPLNQDAERRKSQYILLTAWMVNSPTVSITVNSNAIPFMKNTDLFFIFMCGWTEYSLENEYSKDQVKCNVAGIKSAIKFYQSGNGIKHNKDIEKLADLDSKNELEAWVTTQVAKQ